MTNYFESPFKGVTLDKQVTQPNIRVGRYSYYSGYYHGHSFDDCARFILPDADADRLVIGSFCSIGSGAAFIMAGNQGHRNDWISTDVWIGSEAVIMPGIAIGHGAVIGTRSLVARDVEPYTIVGGNPARPIRKRFDDARIAMLLEMQWWDWSDAQLCPAMPLLTSGDVEALHRYWLDSVRE